MSWTDRITFDERGLVPVVVQDAATGEVLMLAWADRDALRLTAETGEAHYWSRSRRALWRKGATSGHVQRVRQVRVDCDADAVLYEVDQAGPACHTGERSCFHRSVSTEAEDGLAGGADGRHVLSRIEDTVRRREAERPEGSYTTYLFEKGIDKVLKKVGEEAAETLIAAKNPGTAELRSEAADLLFHLLVLFRAKGLELADVWEELDRRFGRAPREGSTADRASRAREG